MVFFALLRKFEPEVGQMLEELLGGVLSVLGEALLEIVGEFCGEGLSALLVARKPQARRPRVPSKGHKKISGPRRRVEQGAESSSRRL